MAIVGDKIVWWGPTPQATRYNVRVIPDGIIEGNLLTVEQYTLYPPIGTVEHDDAVTEYEFNLKGLGVEEGIYDIFVTATDNHGNENDPLALADAVLDFTPPPVITVGGLRWTSA